MEGELELEHSGELGGIKVKDEPEAKGTLPSGMKAGLNMRADRVDYITRKIMLSLLERMSGKDSDPFIFYSLEQIFDHLVSTGHLVVNRFEDLELPATPTKAAVVEAFNALHCSSVAEIIGGVGVRIIKNRIDYNTLDIKWRMLIGENNGPHLHMTQDQRDSSPFAEELVQLYCQETGERPGISCVFAAASQSHFSGRDAAGHLDAKPSRVGECAELRRSSPVP